MQILTNFQDFYGCPAQILTGLQNYILSRRADYAGRTIKDSFRTFMVARTSYELEVKKLPSF